MYLVESGLDTNYSWTWENEINKMKDEVVKEKEKKIIINPIVEEKVEDPILNPNNNNSTSVKTNNPSEMNVGLPQVFDLEGLTIQEYVRKEIERNQVFPEINQPFKFQENSAFIGHKENVKTLKDKVGAFPKTRDLGEVIKMMKQMKEYVDYTKRYYYDFNHVSHLVFFGSKFSGDSQKLILDQIYLSLENNGTEPTFALVADAIFDIGWIKEQMKSVFIDFINYGLWSDSPSAIDKFLVNKQQKFNQLKVKEQTLENYELGMVQSVKDWVEFHKEFKALLVEKKEIWKVNFFELYKFNEIFYTAVTSSSKIQVKSFNKTRTYNVNGVEEETEEEKNINSLAPINPSYLRGKLVSEAQREALKAHGICYFCREQGHKRIDCSKWKLVEQKKVDDRSRNNNSLNTSLVQNYILKKDPNFFYSSSSLSESEINLIDNNTILKLL